MKYIDNMVWRIKEAMSISVLVGKGVFVDDTLIFSIQGKCLGVAWIDNILSNMYSETTKNTKKILCIDEIRSIILKFSETPPPTYLTRLFDLRDTHTRTIILKCVYDWGWLLDKVELTLGETIIKMSLYNRRLMRLRCFCKHIESFTREDILQLLACDKQSFAILKCLFYATKSRRLFRETVRNHVWWLLDVRNGDVDLDKGTPFREKMKMVCINPARVTLVHPRNRFVVDLVNSFKQNNSSI